MQDKPQKYKYRVSFNLTDIGGVRYQNPTLVSSVQINATDKFLNLKDFDAAGYTEEYAAVLNNALGVQPNDLKTSFRSGLPTAFNLNMDYQLASKLYLNALWVQNLRGTNTVAMRQNSLLALTPRLETKGLELALPISLQNNYRVLALGGFVKLGPLFVGSDNLGGLFNVGHAYGANVYAGLSVLNIRSGQKTKKPKTTVPPAQAINQP